MDTEAIKSISIAPTTTIREAMKKLNDTARKILLVVDEHERLLGTVADGDVRRGILASHGFTDPVEAIMARTYTALDYRDPMVTSRAKELMLTHDIAHIPLVDQQQRVRDVIRLADILSDPAVTNVRQRQGNTVVIMAGGRGTRLDVFTKVFPKPLIPIGDKPAIECIMERFSAHGFRTFLYTLNYKKEYVKLFLKEKQFPPDYTIDWVEEKDFLGTAGSLSLLHQQLHETFFVVNCDTLLNVDYTEMLAWHKTQGAALTVVGCHNEVHIPFGVVSLANGRLERIHEKPSHDVIINTGTYIMEPSVLAYLTAGEAMDMNALVNKVAEREAVSVYPVYGQDWLDLGQWDGYQRSTQHLTDHGHV